MPDLPEPVQIVETPIHLMYSYTPGIATSKFLRSIEQGRIVGQRCPRCHKVYVPPRGACSMCGVATEEEVSLPDTGTVTTFCVVNIPSGARSLPVPYVCGQVLVDGADITAMFLLQEVDPKDVHIGMRVKAVWSDERKPTTESISHFKPSGEPDADFSSYKEYV